MAALLPSGAGILIHFKEFGKQFILTGKEGTYLSDIPDIDSKIEELNLIEISKSTKEKKEDAKAKFINFAKKLTKKLEFRVQFSQITGKPGDWHTIYMYLKEDPKYGLIKGRKEPTDADTFATAVRELNEEVGINIESRTNLHSHLPFLINAGGYDFFRHEIKKHVADSIFRWIEIRNANHQGELFKVKFREVSYIITNLNKFNRKSRDAIEYFLSLPSRGGRRTRKTLRRKTLRRKTLRRKTLRRKY